MEQVAVTTLPASEPPTRPLQSSAPEAAALSSHHVPQVLDQLFELYPHLFGEVFLPLKRGIFQELLAIHPDLFQRDALKAALGVHARSTRYLQSVAAGKQWHDLQGVAVEALAPEHIHLALLELFLRRQRRTDQDLRPKLRAQLMTAFEASGLTRQDYLSRVQTKDAQATALLEEVLAEHDQKLARQEALRLAFAGSGKTPAEFAAMYGMDPRTVTAALAQAPSPAD